MRLIPASIVLAGLLAASLPLSAQDREGPWMVRVRAVSLTPANKSDAIASLSVPADRIAVSDRIFPEVDISYFFTPNFSAEVVLTYPQQHDVTLNGSKVGTFKQFPPTLLAQYRLTPGSVLRPYVGVGVNLTVLSNVDVLVPGVGVLDLESFSAGPAGQIGADLRILPGQFLNIDVKKLMLRTDVSTGARKISEARVDPWLISVGYGVRF